DVDAAIEERAGMSIAQLFEQRGEAEFRRIEEHAVRVALAATEPSVLALGGGAVGSEETRTLLGGSFVVLCEVAVDAAWRRVRGSDRPLAQDEAAFRRLYEERLPLYDAVADAAVTDVEGALLAAAGVHHERGAIDRLGELVPGGGPTALAADANV